MRLSLSFLCGQLHPSSISLDPSTGFQFPSKSISQGPFFPVATAFLFDLDLLPNANIQEKSTSCPSLCCPRGKPKPLPLNWTDIQHVTGVIAILQRAEPSLPQTGTGKKGGTGARGGCCWAGGLLTLPSSWTWWGCPASIADGSGQDLLISSQLFAFPPSPTAAWEAPTSSARPPLCRSTLLWRAAPAPAECTMLCHAEAAPCLPTAYLLVRYCHWTLDNEWLGGHGHGLEAEFCHPFSPLSCRFSGAHPVGQQNGIEIGLGRLVSDPPASMTQRIGSGPIAMPLSLGTESRGRGGSQTCRAPSSTSLVFRTSRMALPELAVPGGIRSGPGSAQMDDRTSPTVLFLRRPWR